MVDRAHLPGKFVWFELASSDVAKARAFYAEVLGWRASTFDAGSATFEMFFAGDTPDTMLATLVPTRGGARSRWTASVSVEDVDAAAARAAASGGKVLDAPRDLPGVGRAATIADPFGAEISLFRRASGDPPDAPAPPGRFMWNELHTPDADAALAFYERVVGFTHHSVPSPAGPYHVLAGAAVDRGGITSHLPRGVPSHWLPFVAVADVDATIARAKKSGARVPMEPKDMMDIGRLAILEDPTGALLAVMKPNPRSV